MENLEDSSSKCRRFSDMGIKRFSSARLDDLFKSPGFDFLGRRKRHRTDDDSVSLHSLDLGNIQKSAESCKEKKRRRSLSKLSSSLVNILSPHRPVRKPATETASENGGSGSGGGGSLLRSLSLKNLMSPQSKNHHHKPPTPTSSLGTDKSSVHQDTPYKRPRPSTPKRRRESEFWHQTVSDFAAENYDSTQLRRQEAIYELFKGECDMIDDLDMVKRTYHDSMKALGLMSDEELGLIFGHIDSLAPLHQELVDELKEQRLSDGTTEYVGQVIVAWVPRLALYIDYCSNQVFAKALLDFKKQDPSVEDFLQRCQESPFSRRLDLWSFLDVPRSKMVKYPLLFKAIQKCTPVEHSDHALLSEAVGMVEGLINVVDEKAGEAKCAFTKEKLDYLEDCQRSPLIDESSAVLCDGILKNNRGTKLYVFLFEKILVLTRPATRAGKLKYQVYRQPIPITDLVLEDADSSKMGGSFRSAFTQGQPVKHMFKVSFLDPTSGQSHTLQANDEHDRKQWTSTIRSVLPSRPLPPRRRDSGDGMEESAADPGTPPVRRGMLTRQSSKTSIASTASTVSSSGSLGSAVMSALSRQNSRGKLSKQISRGKLTRHTSGSGSRKRRFSLGRSKHQESTSPPLQAREAADGAN